jgi:hypothetical protein
MAGTIKILIMCNNHFLPFVWFVRLVVILIPVKP